MSKKTINNRRKTNNRRKNKIAGKLKKFGGAPETITDLDDLKYSEEFAKKWVVYKKGNSHVFETLTNSEDVKKYLTNEYEVQAYSQS
jgi:hypothetical protein